MRSIHIYLSENPVWSKVIFYSVTVFFIFFADAILSYWAPNLLEEKLGNATLMGLVMAMSSVVGLIVDIVLPNLLAKTSSGKLLVLAVFTSLIFALLLIVGVSWPLVFIFLLSMAVWGLYYEFIIFANQLFVAGHVPFVFHSGAWAIIGVFKNFAYLLGPLASSYLITKNAIYPGVAAGVLTLFGLTALLVVKNGRNQVIHVDLKNINLIAESKKWLVLLTRVWPVIVISLVLGLVDSVFWTTGALMSGSILFLYQLPSLFVGFVIVKWGIYKGKKKFAEMFLLLSGLFLSFFVFANGQFTIEILVFISSLFSAFTYPLIDGVYSDVVGRMGNEKRHLIGFSSAAISFSYIVGPILAGLMTTAVGEKMTFAYLGIFVMIVSVILLLTTPKKLLLPQTEIKSWGIDN